jgi:hypothetical protein
MMNSFFFILNSISVGTFIGLCALVILCGVIFMFGIICYVGGCCKCCKTITPTQDRVTTIQEVTNTQYRVTYVSQDQPISYIEFIKPPPSYQDIKTLDIIRPNIFPTQNNNISLNSFQYSSDSDF